MFGPKRLSLGGWLLGLFVLVGHQLVMCDEHDHEYEPNEEVVLWVNTVGPYHNRQETYPYFSLPYCPGPKASISHYHETLGETLNNFAFVYQKKAQFKI